MEGVDIPQVLHELKTLRRWDYTENASWEWQNVAGTKTKVYTKYFTGTTLVAGQTNIGHGVTQSKILQCTSQIVDLTTGNYVVYDYVFGNVAAFAYLLFISTTNIVFSNVGGNLQGQNYKIKMEYYL